MKKHLPMILLLVLVVSLAYWQWFFTPDIFTWGDWGWYFRNTIKAWFAPPQLWTISATGGIDISLTQYIPIRFLTGLFAQWWDFNYVDRFVFLFPSVIFTALSSYFLGYYLLKSRGSALFSSLVFTFNSYAITLREGHFTLGIAFGLAPLVILFFMMTLHRPSLKTALITGFFSWLSFSYEPRAFLIIGWILMAYFIYYHIFIKRPSSVGDFLKKGIFAAIPLLILIITSLPGLIGLKLASSTIASQVLNRSLFGSGYVNIQRGFTLSIHAWTENVKLIRSDILYIMPYFWIVPIMAFLGLWVGRKNKLIVFWGGIALVGIFLVKQSNQPFVNVYSFLYQHLPGFNAFREPSKFYFLIGISYSILVANLVSYLIRSNRSRKYILVGLMACPLLANIFPVIQAQVGQLQIARHIPTDYLHYQKFISDNYGDYRTLYIPSDPRWGYWDQHIRKLSAINSVLFEWPELADYHQEGLEYSYIDHVMSLFEKDFAPNFLNQYGVKYVVVPPEDIANNDIFTFAWGNRSDYLQRVSALPYLQPLQLPTQELTVFENPTARPIIYWTPEPERLDSDQPYFPVKFTRLSQAEFDLFLDQIPATGSVTLNFSEKFDSRWRLFSPPFSWTDVFRSSPPHFSSVHHSPSPLHTNSFTLNLDRLRQESPQSFLLNPNGSSQIHLRLYYTPQAYVNVGTYVSAIAWLALVSGIIFLQIRRHD